MRWAAIKPVKALKTLWETIFVLLASFLLLVGGAMLASHLGTSAEDPLKSPDLKVLKEKLRANPQDEGLKKSIRDLDLKLRRDYFNYLARMNTGIWLLLAGAAASIFAAGRHLKQTRALPYPNGTRDLLGSRPQPRTAQRLAVAGAGAVVMLLLAGLGLIHSPVLPPTAIAAENLLSAAGAPDEAPVATHDLRKNWTRFLGPDGNGHAPLVTAAPTEWDAASGKGVLWKAAVPAPGFNSPIIWQDRIFFSGGNDRTREVFCFSAVNGQMLWRQTLVLPSAGKKTEVPDTTGYAAPTMATDGLRVYVMFSNGDMGAFSLEGKPIWSKTFSPLENPYGHATSLAAIGSHLVIQLDQGEAEQGKSKLFALDGATGKSLWEQPRKAGSSWATPAVCPTPHGDQIVAIAVPFAVAYDAKDGHELWRVDCLNGEVTPSPIFAGGQLFVCSPSEKVVAVKPDGKGDVTKTHVAWEFEENIPDVTSPASDGELLFLLTTSGVLSCVDTKTGKRAWEHDFEMECHASPAIATGKVYLFSQRGRAVVVEAKREFKELFRTEMPDSFHASPAFVNDKLIVRGITNLWCLGPAGKAQP